MNTFMYSHPLTPKQLTIVRDEIGYTVVGPINKALACGDDGKRKLIPPNLHLPYHPPELIAETPERLGCHDGMERHCAACCRPILAFAPVLVVAPLVTDEY
jgi:hypothetical protein